MTSDMIKLTLAEEKTEVIDEDNPEHCSCVREGLYRPVLPSTMSISELLLLEG